MLFEFWLEAETKQKEKKEITHFSFVCETRCDKHQTKDDISKACSLERMKENTK